MHFGNVLALGRRVSFRPIRSGLRVSFRPIRSSLAARIPERLDELCGPALGVVVLPVHLTWHGLREFDVSDTPGRLSLYTIVLSQGKRADIARFVHAGLLCHDWPQLRSLVSAEVRDVCAQRFGLAR
jgi:hypothetical protein